MKFNCKNNKNKDRTTSFALRIQRNTYKWLGNVFGLA